MSGMRLLVPVALAALMAGCATFPTNDERAPGMEQVGYRYDVVDALTDPQRNDPRTLVVLAFSGGGTRAAAYAYAVLEELADTDVGFDGRLRSLVDEVDFVSGVSGGSFTAAYFGLHGRGIFDDFRSRVLERNMQSALLLRLLWPINWIKLFSPYWARSDLAADYYDDVIFEGATYGDLARRGGPFTQVHATDLTTGSPFAFSQDQFDFLCSDLDSYPLSRAVAASSAVPLLLSPITLRRYKGCGFEPPDWVTETIARGDRLDRQYVNARNLEAYLRPERRYVRLVDGVVSDNLGVRGPYEAWMQREFETKQRPAGNRTRVVAVLIVNAQTTPDAQWDRFDVLPSLGVILDMATSAQVNRYNLETVELLRRTFDVWNETTSQWDPPLYFRLVETSFVDVRDEDERRYLNGLSTSLALSDRALERLDRDTRLGLRESRGFRALLDELDALGPPDYGPEEP